MDGRADLLPQDSDRRPWSLERLQDSRTDYGWGGGRPTYRPRQGPPKEPD
ncbi:MAG: hypothetical protein U0931_18375 [Vulcanimicrobiota bacterium]